MKNRAPILTILGALFFVGGCPGFFLVNTFQPSEDRSIDGSGNNLAHPDWGKAFTMERRMATPAYMDGMSMPARMNQASPRAISNMVVDQAGQSILNDANLSDWVWQWGQFIDHDLNLSLNITPNEPFPINVPSGDPMFDPTSTGNQLIMLLRSEYDLSTGTAPGNPRQQVNELTAYIDASNVYGSDAVRAAWLRSGVGGELKTGDGNLLPFSDGTMVNGGPGNQPSFSTSLFTAGDIRANEQAGLTAVHTLFMREHNRLAREIASAHPDWSDEQIYQRARKMVGALVQVITYREFLPALLGPYSPDAAAGHYDPNVNASIANEFANAAYRIGHTMISPQIQRRNPDGTPWPAGALPLREAFFDPQKVILQGGIEPLLLGLSVQRMQRIDNMIVDDLRNFLFGQPGQGGLDLSSLNMQRGRDHGLPDYNSLREAYGLARKASFAEISSDPQVQQRLQQAYPDVNSIDPWLGGICEDHLPGAQVGELITTVLGDQFTRLRDGDRFFYRYDPSFSLLDVFLLENTRLSDVIRRNTGITALSGDVFHVAP